MNLLIANSYTSKSLLKAEFFVKSVTGNDVVALSA
jgi:hypothetical protein